MYVIRKVLEKNLSSFELEVTHRVAVGRGHQLFWLVHHPNVKYHGSTYKKEIFQRWMIISAVFYCISSSFNLDFLIFWFYSSLYKICGLFILLLLFYSRCMLIVCNDIVRMKRYRKKKERNKWYASNSYLNSSKTILNSSFYFILFFENFVMKNDGSFLLLFVYIVPFFFCCTLFSAVDGE